jgi:hypothetical protein
MDTDGGMRIPPGPVLLSSDGKRGFAPLDKLSASRRPGISAVEFASSASWEIPILQLNGARASAVTIRQWRNLEGFDQKLAIAMSANTKTFADFKILDAPDYEHLLVAHVATPPNTGEERPRGGALTILAIDRIDPIANKVIASDRRAIAWLKDRNVNRFLIPDSTAGYWRVGSEGTRLGPLPTNLVPIHMDIAADVLVMAVATGTPRRFGTVQFWRLSNGERLSTIEAPAGYESGSFAYHTALLPGGRLLASFVPFANNESREYRLWSCSAGQASWENEGPFKLYGSSNSGRVLFLRKAQPGTLDLLVWPRVP